MIQSGARLAQIGAGLTAAERLRQAAGLVGPATAAALLVAWSGLASASAATHLLAERSASQGGGGRTSISQRRPAQADYSLIPLAVFIITSGVLDDS